MVIQCYGIDQLTDCLERLGKNRPGIAENMIRRCGPEVCILVDRLMEYQGFARRDYFEKHGSLISTFDEVFGTPEEFGQMTLDEVLCEELCPSAKEVLKW